MSGGLRLIVGFDGAAFAQERRALGWTQAALARATGYSETMFQRWERGRRTPSAVAYRKILDVLWDQEAP